MNDIKQEMRVFSLHDLEIRESNDGETSISGYAAVYNQMSEDLGGFREIIRPGFFEPVMGDDVRALFNHDSNYVLGRTTAGTLNLKDDRKGLRVSIDPPDTQWAKDLMVSMKRGDVDQMSFGFFVDEDVWKKDRNDQVMRELVKAKRLLDVSIVTYPAYPQTSAEARSKASELAGGDGQAAGIPDFESARATVQARHAKRRLELKKYRS